MGILQRLRIYIRYKRSTGKLLCQTNNPASSLSTKKIFKFCSKY